MLPWKHHVSSGEKASWNNATWTLSIYLPSAFAEALELWLPCDLPDFWKVRQTGSQDEITVFRDGRPNWAQLVGGWSMTMTGTVGMNELERPEWIFAFSLLYKIVPNWKTPYGQGPYLPWWVLPKYLLNEWTHIFEWTSLLDHSQTWKKKAWREWGFWCGKICWVTLRTYSLAY